MTKGNKRYITTEHPPAIGFDTGSELLILPYISLKEARLPAERLEMILEFTDWTIILTGHNLAVFAKDVLSFSVSLVTAMPDLPKLPEAAKDSYISKIECVRRETEENREGGEEES